MIEKEKYEGIIRSIDSSCEEESIGFSLIQLCSQLLAVGDSESLSQVEKIAIHILDKWKIISDDLKPIWSDIIEAVGYYPYLEKCAAQGVEVTSLAEKIRQQYHKSHYIEGVYMHSEQKRISDVIFSGRNVVVSAPTSFGKSLLIEEIVASRKYKNIVVIQPTLALLDETRRKLKKYNQFYKIIVRTTQQPSQEQGNLFLLTAERVVEYSDFPQIDFLIIDEFYKLSMKRMDSVRDGVNSYDRVNALNNAFLRIYNTFSPQFYLLGPNTSISSRFKQRYNVEYINTSYSLVDSSIVDMTKSYDTGLSAKKKEIAKIEALFSLLYNRLSDEQTLVFCSSPAHCRKLAEKYSVYVEERQPTKRDLPICAWISELFPQWSLNKYLRYGIGIHDASLPKHIGNSIVRYFNQKRTNVVFCTSTIIEGVNTSAHNVVIFDDNKGGNKLDYFDFCNIKGRAGRMMEHFIGYLYNFIEIPPYEALSIDIPFCDQQEEITSEVLVNIEEKDVLQHNKKRYKKLNEIPKELLALFKQNGVSIENQKNAIDFISQKVKTKMSKDISWKSIPTWDNLIATFEIADKCSLLPFDNCIHNVKQLCAILVSYMKHKNLSNLVDEHYKYLLKNNKGKGEQKCYDNAVEYVFRIHRTWFQYVIPKALRVIDSLQKYVLEKEHLPTGSYSFYVQELESDFLPSNLTILIEYGLPASTIRKILSLIPKEISEDEVLAYVKTHSLIYKNISCYEQELIEIM